VAVAEPEFVWSLDKIESLKEERQNMVNTGQQAGMLATTLSLRIYKVWVVH
jgi:uncharacterized protein YllA (UPF0747 family)